MTYVRHTLLLTLGLLLVAAPLSGCDGVGSSGSDENTGDDADEDAPTAPAAPSNLSASAQDGAAALTWEPVDAADTYNVYRSATETDSASGDPLATDVADAEYTDGTAQNGQVYHYRVTALTDTLESDGSDEVEVEMPAADPGGGDDTDGSESWTRVKTNTDNTIHDVAYTTEGAYAVAGGGVLLERRDTTWAKVLTDGPSSNGNDLFGLDVTADGTHLWLVGASGAIGEYDVTTGSLTDRSAPMDVTNNFTDVAVTGQSGSARVTVTGASGKVYYSASNGESGTWKSVTPGSGAAVRAVDFYAGTEGHIVDGNQSVFATTDGKTWPKTGISDADVGFEGVDSDAADDVWVVGGSGTVFHWDGSSWSTTTAGEPTLVDVVVAEDDQSGFAVGNSGAVFAYDGSAWARQETPTGQNLTAVVQGDPAIAVGAGGTILER
jgi:hypothetical protein